LQRMFNDEIFMCQAILAGAGSTCFRRMVGCVLTNRLNHVIGVGRNGVPRGIQHCIDHKCPGADLPSGTGLDACLASHAEMNALIQCRNVEEIDTCYTTSSPCMQCVKSLLNTGCTRIVFLEEYPHPEVKDLWINSEGGPKGWARFESPLASSLMQHLRDNRPNLAQGARLHING